MHEYPDVYADGYSLSSGPFGCTLTLLRSEPSLAPGSPHVPSEVVARVRLSAQLAKAISDFGFDITFARIGTERGVAIDTFYIESANHEPVEDPDRLQKLRSALSEVITPAPVQVAEEA